MADPWGRFVAWWRKPVPNFDWWLAVSLWSGGLLGTTIGQLLVLHYL